jgi:hypothetical protein
VQQKIKPAAPVPGQTSADQTGADALALNAGQGNYPPIASDQTGSVQGNPALALNATGQTGAGQGNTAMTLNTPDQTGTTIPDYTGGDQSARDRAALALSMPPPPPDQGNLPVLAPTVPPGNVPFNQPAQDLGVTGDVVAQGSQFPNQVAPDQTPSYLDAQNPAAAYA